MDVTFYYVSFFLCFFVTLSRQNNDTTTNMAASSNPTTNNNVTVTVNVNDTRKHIITTNRPTKNGVTTKRPTKNGVTTKHPTKNGVTTKRPTKNGVTTKSPTNKGVTHKKPAPKLVNKNKQHGTPRAVVDLNPAQKQIVDGMSWPLKIMFYKEHLAPSTTEKPLFQRRVGVESLILGGGRKNNDDDCDDDNNDEENDSDNFNNDDFDNNKNGNGKYHDKNGNKLDQNGNILDKKGKKKRDPNQMDLTNEDVQMKLRLFTLMDETARDCDLKVRRAELIRGHYKNNTAFEVGFLMGSISDKHRHMTDTASTLKRLFGDWKPIEHINAYEQVANQAIEISHLIETAKHAIKKLDSDPSELHFTDETDPASKRKRSS